jgi:hypothetical protein
VLLRFQGLAYASTLHANRQSVVFDLCRLVGFYHHLGVSANAVPDIRNSDNICCWFSFLIGRLAAINRLLLRFKIE